MDIYQELKKAFDFYNQRLFHNELPECIFTLSRVSDTIGYFSPNRFGMTTVNFEGSSTIFLT
jgi:hypothetical protein